MFLKDSTQTEKTEVESVFLEAKTQTETTEVVEIAIQTESAEQLSACSPSHRVFNFVTYLIIKKLN